MRGGAARITSGSASSARGISTASEAGDGEAWVATSAAASLSPSPSIGTRRLSLAIAATRAALPSGMTPTSNDAIPGRSARSATASDPSPERDATSSRAVVPTCPSARRLDDEEDESPPTSPELEASRSIDVGTFVLEGGRWGWPGDPPPPFSAGDLRIEGNVFLPAQGDGGAARIVVVFGLQGLGSDDSEA